MLFRMDRVVRAVQRGLVCSVVVGVVAWGHGPTTVHAGPQRHVSVEALAKRLTAWVRASDRQAHHKAAQRVSQGVPPLAMAAFLSAASEHPDEIYVPIYEKAARYRNPVVRGQALIALATVGPSQAERAITTAADDHERTVRRLAWALAERHPSPVAHEVVVRMLERDPELAEEVAALEIQRQAEARARQEQEDEADIVIFADGEPGDESGAHESPERGG